MKDKQNETRTTKKLFFGNINISKFFKQNKITTLNSFNHTVLANVVISKDNIKLPNDKLKKEVEKNAKRFVNVLSKNCHNANLEKFFHNFSVTKFNLEHIGEKSNVIGIYLPWNLKKQIVYLYCFSATNHEFMHMASTNVIDNYTCIGFCITYENFKRSIGRYFNEGYTQLMVERYLKPKNHSYRTFVVIAREIEELIGKDKMETLFFTDGLIGLIEEFKNYADFDNIIDFLNNVDELHNIEMEYNKANSISDKIINSKKYYAILSKIDIFINNCKNKGIQKRLN